MAFRTTLAVCLLAGAAGWGGCSPEEVQLEGEQNGLLPEGAELYSTDGLGCAMVVLKGGRSGEIRFSTKWPDGTPTIYIDRWSDGSDARPGVSAGMSDNCGPSGPYDLSISFNGRTVLREKTVVPYAKQSVVMVYAHTMEEPRWSVSEVDLSSAGPGLRRARFTNYVTGEAPIEMFFYDASDQPVGESVSVAWGETWGGTIPSAATAYRLSPDQPVSTPMFDPRFESQREPIDDLPCVEALPVGLVVTSTYVEIAEFDWRGTRHAVEMYKYLPPVCSET